MRAQRRVRDTIRSPKNLEKVAIANHDILSIAIASMKSKSIVIYRILASSQTYRKNPNLKHMLDRHKHALVLNLSPSGEIFVDPDWPQLTLAIQTIYAKYPGVAGWGVSRSVMFDHMGYVYARSRITAGSVTFLRRSRRCSLHQVLRSRCLGPNETQLELPCRCMIVKTLLNSMSMKL